ncbi:MAG: type II toxin-antitoxin system VapB family antitoxin [Deltaproteobacteria bacterium]|nr:type II toxin-antitoxin system VapB family antitoxin [Deltaproteobacteria bacterium]
MRTTLDLPQTLIDEAQNILGYTSKTDTVIFSLRELVRRKRIEELKKMAGHLELEIDLSKSRRRPRRMA